MCINTYQTLKMCISRKRYDGYLILEKHLRKTFISQDLLVSCKSFWFWYELCIPSEFLAHLSRRLTGWAYSIPMVRRPSVVVVIHTFKLEYLCSQLANLDQILCVASLGWGKGSIRFWGGFDQNYGFHGNRKPPLTYNGENDVSTFSRLFLIRSFLYLQVTRTCIKSHMSLNFGQIGPFTMELAALERLKNFPLTYNGKMLSPC